MRESFAVSLYISETFYRLWHDSLLNTLILAFFAADGIPVGFCTWTGEFLTGRSIRIVINASVPQGPVLFATLFLLHTKA